MTLRIIAIAGPLKGAVYALDDDLISIGRDAQNRIAIHDKSVSRRHCVIERQGDGFRVRDLDSHNGTFVNNLPVKEQGVGHGDRLKVGTSYFIFLSREEEGPDAPAEVEFEDTVVTGSTLHLKVEDALYKVARDLGVLLKISQTLDSAGTLKQLQRRLLESLFESVPADRGAILLTDEGVGEAVSLYAPGRSGGADQAIRISRTVAQQVLGGGAAMLCYNILGHDVLSNAESLRASSIRSLLCVPLRLRGRVLGLIYLDSSASDLTDGHLQLVSAVASFAAGALDGARRVEWLEGENKRLQADLFIDHQMVGESSKMSAVYQTIAKVAPTDTTVLILGESGTGKELAARAIHQNSPRAGRPFIAINCAAITETLMESELFGYEKGAFTGAAVQMKGKLEAASGGTVFFDELGDMPLLLQAKILRVLQERELTRVGGTRPVKTDIRVLAATNSDLEKAVAAGAFRPDLYYRFNVITLRMPPLRERAADVPRLAAHFIAKHGERCKRRVSGISPEAQKCLMSYDWPGNVRELENVIESALVLGSADEILPEDLPERVLEAAPPSASTPFNEAVIEAKRQIVLKAMRLANGNYKEAARALGLLPANLHRLIRNLDLKSDLGG